MTLFRAIHDKNNPYTLINKKCSEDERLSFKAKGIWMYAFSRPNDWEFYLADLVKRSKDKKDSVKAGLKELEENGYLHRKVKQNKENGKMEGWEWYFFETPKSDEEIKKMFPKEGKSDRRLTPSTSNPTLLNKECSVNNDKNIMSVANQDLPSGNQDIVVKISNDQSIKLDINELFLRAVSSRVKYDTEELKYAWDVLGKYKGIVYDWWRFIEGTIENHKKMIKSQKITSGAYSTGSNNTKTNKEFSCQNKVYNKKSNTTKENMSEKDTREQPSVKLTSLKSFVEEWLNG